MLHMAPQYIDLGLGKHITHSVVVRNRVYNLTAKDEIQTPVIVISGENVVVDFNGATLRGSNENTPPDQRKGLAILVENGKNITIKNANIHGYKLAILARNTTGLHITHCNWSYNWKQHLKSTLEKEDESDWMFFHHNEHDEWIYGTQDQPAYGCGGVYLTNCDHFEVDRCMNNGSQCGLMLNRSDHGQIWGNDFSFLSAIGVGLYRSNHNLIQQNRIDYCVRGYSHGVYSRGQDSAGLLIYEQSSKNIFAYNSATHGGDGFFLWAGQTTMDTVEGGCNDNLVYENDFSHSPANGIETTFSRNTFIGNKCVECWHGVWGGYSFDSEFSDNIFWYCGQAISIEHGRKNRIENNQIADCDSGIGLWATPPDPNWEYPKKHETSSRDYDIVGNTFTGGVNGAISLDNTQDVRIRNCYFQLTAPLLVKGDCHGLVQSGNSISRGATSEGQPWDVPVSDLLNPLIYAKSDGPRWMQGNGNNILASDPSNDNAFHMKWPHPTLKIAVPKKAVSDKFWRSDLRGDERGRKYILVDEWGPYDFRSPIIWPRGERKATTQEAGREPDSARPLVEHFEILGPRGHWRIIDKQGVEWVSTENGATRATIDVKQHPGADLKLVLEFTGEAMITPFGKHIPAKTPYRFEYVKPRSAQPR